MGSISEGTWWHLQLELRFWDQGKTGCPGSISLPIFLTPSAMWVVCRSEPPALCPRAASWGSEARITYFTDPCGWPHASDTPEFCEHSSALCVRLPPPGGPRTVARFVSTVTSRSFQLWRMLCRDHICKSRGTAERVGLRILQDFTNTTPSVS